MVVALDFEHAVLNRAARPTGRPESFAQRRQCRGVEFQATDYGYDLATATFGLMAHPNNAIAPGCLGGRWGAGTLGHGFAAGGAHPTTISGINEATGTWTTHIQNPTRLE